MVGELIVKCYEEDDNTVLDCNGKFSEVSIVDKYMFMSNMAEFMKMDMVDLIVWVQMHCDGETKDIMK